METYTVEQPTFTFGCGDAPSGYSYSLADEDLFCPPSPPQGADQEAGVGDERPLLRGGGEHLRLSGELVRPLEPVASPQIREATHTVVVNEGAAAALRAKVFGAAPLGILSLAQQYNTRIYSTSVLYYSTSRHFYCNVRVHPVLFLYSV